FHKGELPEAQRKLAQQLEDASGTANINLSRTDVGGKLTPSQQKLWGRDGKGAGLPWLLVQYPEDEEKAPPAWAGPLDAKSVGLLLDSPARREVVKRLCRGDSAVWVLLTSGDRK